MIIPVLIMAAMQCTAPGGQSHFQAGEDTTV